MKLFIILSGIIIILCLIAEKKSAVRHRRALLQVIHVNGTRGKSAVTRLIAAGLTGSGYRVFCKTTGTLPMTIDCDGNERLIRRRGSANIREQIKCLKEAYENNAEILVVECMAVDPELQYVCEHRILNSSISVITNVRIDHVAEMGSTVSDVCSALCNTVCENGAVFTSDTGCFDMIESSAAASGSKAFLAVADEAPTAERPFPENYALALAVCEYVGADRQAALEGMEHVLPDPYAASRCRLPGGAFFIDAMSANDPVSTEAVIERLSEGLDITEKIFILNCRPDRTYRTGLMTDLIKSHGCNDVWLIGRGNAAAFYRLRSGMKVIRFRDVSGLPLERYGKGTLICAIGNIAGPGIELIERVRQLETEIHAEGSEADVR